MSINSGMGLGGGTPPLVDEGESKTERESKTLNEQDDKRNGPINQVGQNALSGIGGGGGATPLSSSLSLENIPVPEAKKSDALTDRATHLRRQFYSHPIFLGVVGAAGMVFFGIGPILAMKHIMYTYPGKLEEINKLSPYLSAISEYMETHQLDPKKVAGDTSFYAFWLEQQRLDNLKETTAQAEPNFRKELADKESELKTLNEPVVGLVLENRDAPDKKAAIEKRISEIKSSLAALPSLASIEQQLKQNRSDLDAYSAKLKLPTPGTPTPPVP